MTNIPGWRLALARGATPGMTWDRSESRPLVAQHRPGKPIHELAGRHSGACAVLFNGPSLALHDLHATKVPLIGMNRTFVGYAGYNGPEPDYYCYVDLAWQATAKRLDGGGRTIVVNGSTDNHATGYRATRHTRMSPFSMDLWRDGYVSPIPCTTGHLALQLAAYLGFRDIFALGLDMGGPHFDGTPASRAIQSANAYHVRQASVLRAHGVRVWVTGSPESRCTAFPRAPFDALLQAGGH